MAKTSRKIKRPSVTLWPEQMSWLDKEIKKGRFASVSHAFRELIRLDQQHRREISTLRHKLYKHGGDSDSSAA